jgi:hypothetical protein
VRRRSGGGPGFVLHFSYFARGSRAVREVAAAEQSPYFIGNIPLSARAGPACFGSVQWGASTETISRIVAATIGRGLRSTPKMAIRGIWASDCRRMAATTGRGLRSTPKSNAAEHRPPIEPNTRVLGRGPQSTPKHRLSITPKPATMGRAGNHGLQAVEPHTIAQRGLQAASSPVTVHGSSPIAPRASVAVLSASATNPGMPSASTSSAARAPSSPCLIRYVLIISRSCSASEVTT